MSNFTRQIGNVGLVHLITLSLLICTLYGITHGCMTFYLVAYSIYLSCLVVIFGCTLLLYCTIPKNSVAFEHIIKAEKTQKDMSTYLKHMDRPFTKLCNLAFLVITVLSAYLTLYYVAIPVFLLNMSLWLLSDRLKYLMDG